MSSEQKQTFTATLAAELHQVSASAFMILLLLGHTKGALEGTVVEHWQKTVNSSLLRVIQSTAHYILLPLTLASNKQH